MGGGARSGEAARVSAMTVRLGDLPSWFAAVGTVGAFGVSLWLLRQQMQDRRVQSADRI